MGRIAACDKLLHSDFGFRISGFRRALVLTLCASALALLCAPRAQAAEAATWEQRPGARVASVHPAGPNRTGFTQLAGSAVGIAFTNRLSDERSVISRNLLNGSGVAAGDFDGDGWCDLYLCALEGGNHLYRNLGDWKFQDVTDEAGVGCPGQYSTGACFADIDGDGRLDLLVTSLGNGLRIFHNEGGGHFKEITAEAGVASKRGSVSMALADIDGDGDLDLYVANYFPTTIRDRPTTRVQVQPVNGKPTVIAVDGRPVTQPDLTNRFEIAPNGEVVEFSEPSDLFINDGHGHFTRASFTDGRFLDEDGKPLTEPPRDWSLSVRFYDFTGDGAPDIYVCNDLFSPDRIWINDGKGRFRAMPRLAVRHTSTFSMGMDFGDLNRDGQVDFMVVDMLSRDLRNRKVQIAGLTPNFAPPGLIDNRPQAFQNTLQINRGDGTFAEVADFAGVAASEWSWQPVFLDVDLDGYEDILIPNGVLRDFQNADMGRRIESAVASRRMSPTELAAMFREFPGLISANLCFRNLGNLHFEEVGERWGFGTKAISQGLALADLDNDGDLDVILNNFDGEATLYRNETTAPRLLVQLKGRPPNTQAIGARLRVTGGPVDQTQEIVAGGRYLSGDQAVRVFAAGSRTQHLTIEVTWRDGGRTVVHDVPANSRCEIDEAHSSREPVPQSPAPAVPLFEDVSDRIAHVHVEDPFDDYGRQFLLPRMYSQLGPGVSWIDLDQDGRDDLAIGTGSGGRVALFHNEGGGRFRRLDQAPFNTVMNRDTTTLLGLPSTNGLQILAGSANFEDGSEQGAVARTFDLAGGRVLDQLPGQPSSTGPMALADVNGDGILDLFVGGRITTGHYPEAASSFLFLGKPGGGFQLDPRNADRFVRVGLISGAVFSDLDGDGDPDLVLTCEWGPVRVFRNDQGVFTDVTQSWGLSSYTGWWNGVTTVDLDGDGRMDIVASNWGLNTHYHASREYPQRIYYGDFTDSGVVGLIDACYDPALGYYVPERDLRVMRMGLPFLRDRFTDFQSFAVASVAQVLGDFAPRAHQLEANTLGSMAFLNRGDHWEGHLLPDEAQFTTAMAVVAGDFDGDGNQDIFLSQNFFEPDPFSKRNDAGRGLLLKGDGRGNLRAVPGQESGLLIYGDQRGAAASDFDGDGRLDLVVTQNGAETKLFHNLHARPGLRVRLRGPALNPTGIGATVRVRFGEQLGPAQEVRAGAGYWSQDSAVLVFGTPTAPSAVWVRWPGGQTSTTPVPTGASEVTIPAP
jgi:hypothetical protein